MSNENLNNETNYTHVECGSNNLDSSYYLNNYVEIKKPAFEGWFKDDKLVKIEIDGKVIDFSEKTDIGSIIDKAVGKLVDLRYRLNLQVAK